MKKWIWMGVLFLLLAVVPAGCKKEEKPETTKEISSEERSTEEETGEQTRGQEEVPVPGLRFEKRADADGKKGLVAEAVLLPTSQVFAGEDVKAFSEELASQKKDGACAAKTYDSWDAVEKGLGITGLRNRVDELTWEEISSAGIEVTITADAEGTWQRILVNARYRYEEAEIEARAILHTDAFAGQIEERWFYEENGATLPKEVGYETFTGQEYHVLERYQSDAETYHTGVIWAEERVLYEVDARGTRETIGAAEDLRELVEKTFREDNDVIGRQLPPMPEAPAIRMSEAIFFEGTEQKFLQYVLQELPAEGTGAFAEKWKQDILRDYEEWTPYSSEDPGRHYAQFADQESFYEGSGLTEIEFAVEDAGVPGLSLDMMGEETEEELEEDLAMPYGIVLTIEGNRRGEPTKYWAEANYKVGEIGIQLWAGQYTKAYRDWPETWEYEASLAEETLTTAKGKTGYLLGKEEADPNFARADAVFISDSVVYFLFVHGPKEQETQVQEVFEKILAVY